MFERFTDRARRVVVLAQEEARGLQHNYIGTEHLLAGLAAEEDGVGRKVLDQLGVPLALVRSEIERIIGRGKEAVGGGHIPFTPRAKAALEFALRESMQLGHNYIGTEHILLGLLHGEGVAMQLLERHTGGVGHVRTAIIGVLSGFGPSPGAPPPSGSPTRWTPALAAAMETAAGRTAGGIGTHHVLSVFADWDDVAANHILRAGGFDASKLPAAIADWDVAGTRDETEEAWALRVTDIDVDDEGRLRINLNEPELRARVLSALSSDDADVRAAFARLVRELQQKLPPPGDAVSPGGSG